MKKIKPDKLKLALPFAVFFCALITFVSVAMAWFTLLKDSSIKDINIPIQEQGSEADLAIIVNDVPLDGENLAALQTLIPGDRVDFIISNIKSANRYTPTFAVSLQGLEGSGLTIPNPAGGFYTMLDMYTLYVYEGDTSTGTYSQEDFAQKGVLSDFADGKTIATAAKVGEKFDPIVFRLVFSLPAEIGFEQIGALKGKTFLFTSILLVAGG